MSYVQYINGMLKESYFGTRTYNLTPKMHLTYLHRIKDHTESIYVYTDCTSNGPSSFGCVWVFSRVCEFSYIYLGADLYDRFLSPDINQPKDKLL